MRIRDFIDLVESAGLYDFKRDNPKTWNGEEGQEWVDRHQRNADDAADKHPTDTGITGCRLRGAATGYMGRRRPFYLPAAFVASIRGCNREDRKPGDGQYDRLIAKVDQEGFSTSPDHAVLIGVNHHGEAYVIEGNTRARVALAKGVEYIPAEVTWFNGAEEVDGPYSPARIAAIGRDHP